MEPKGPTAALAFYRPIEIKRSFDPDYLQIGPHSLQTAHKHPRRAHIGCQAVSPDPLSPLPSGSRPPRGAHPAEDRLPAADGVTLQSVRVAVGREETRALRADGYPVIPTTL